MTPVPVARPVTLTSEQSQIVGFDGKQLVVKAYAGTGKTFTLVQYTLAKRDKRFLYLAYNRAIRDEAVGKFPDHVDCKTSHQLAYAEIGRLYQHKLMPNLRVKEVADMLQAPNWRVAADVIATLNNFMVSAERGIGPALFCAADDNSPKGKDRTQYARMVSQLARSLWEKMIDIEHACPMTHDAYFKLYQLQQPDLSRRYDIILYDEGQDGTAVTTALVTSQACGLVICGDTHQQIYAFRGARDALDDAALAGAERRYLTQSFRFGPQVAAVANALLALKGETRPVQGLGKADRVSSSSDFRLSSCPRPITFLARTVMGVIQMAMYFSRKGIPLALIGGEEAYALCPLENAYWLSRGERARITDRRLAREFSSFRDYVEMAEETKDPEMLRTIKILDTSRNLPQDLARLRQNLTAADAPLVTLCTAHRAKGLEWPWVYLMDDFPDVLSPDLDAEARDQEINLLYVAATRAQEHLVLNEQAEAVVRHMARQRRRVPA